MALVVSVNFVVFRCGFGLFAGSAVCVCDLLVGLISAVCLALACLVGLGGSGGFLVLMFCCGVAVLPLAFDLLAGV